MPYGAARCPPAYTPNFTQPQGNPNTRHIQHRYRSYVELTSFEIVCIRPLYANLRDSHEPPSQPDLPHPGPKGRQGDQQPAPPSPPWTETANRHGRPVPPLVAENRAPPASPHRGDRSQPAIVVALVRARSARHRKHLVLAGHHRAPPPDKNRRSRGLHPWGLGPPSSMRPGSSPSSGTRTWSLIRTFSPRSKPVKGRSPEHSVPDLRIWARPSSLHPTCPVRACVPRTGPRPAGSRPGPA
jgi:hypothetical protein